MSRIDTHFKCGHTVGIHLWGTDEEVEIQRQAMERACLCPECLINKVGWLPSVPFETAMEKAGELKLPCLKGSFKQIKWAFSLRGRIFAMPIKMLWAIFEQESLALRQIPQYSESLNVFDIDFDYQPRDNLVLVWKGFLLEARQIDDSTWWIAREDHCARELANAALREYADAYTINHTNNG